MDTNMYILMHQINFSTLFKMHLIDFSTLIFFLISLLKQPEVHKESMQGETTKAKETNNYTHKQHWK